MPHNTHRVSAPILSGEKCRRMDDPDFCGHSVEHTSKINYNGVVDMLDLSELSSYWLYSCPVDE